MSKIRNDPATYRALDVPFSDSDAANAAIEGFFSAVETLRREHKIADVIVIVECSMMTGDRETRGTARLALGASHNTLPMIARAYGEERQVHEEQLALTIASGRKRAAK
jgi:hypothetical protein